MSKTGFFSHPQCRAHNMGAGHPECPERMDAIEDRILATGLDVVLQRREAPLASNEVLQRAHSASHVVRIREMDQRVQAEGGPDALGYLDPDTAMCTDSMGAALRAAGAAVAATDAVMAGELDNAFCSVRPPGHHACRDRPMGFCIFNSVAVAALHALEHHGLARVAIVDFDVHHGNGTEDIFDEDDRVLMLGIFQHPFYPYSGTEPAGDNMINLPVPAFTKGPRIREMIEANWFPRLEAFKPEMIFISAGFDAHQEDDLGRLGLVEADYVWMTQRLMEIAKRHAKGRIVSSLEGGYNLSALGRSVEAHVRALAEI